jgi:hypothetical protein
VPRTVSNQRANRRAIVSRVHFAAQIVDVHIHQVAHRIFVQPPDLLDDRGAADRMPRIPHEEFQQRIPSDSDQWCGPNAGRYGKAIHHQIVHLRAGAHRIRQLSLVVAEMDLVLPRSKELRAAHPELSAPLDHYLRLASDLQHELQRVHMRLLARRSELEAARARLNAASQFVSTLPSAH